MKKDKEIWLDPEEIQQLLEGGLYWTDIEPKLAPENADSFRRPSSIEAEEEPGELPTFPKRDWEPDEQKDVRAILLGEEKHPERAAQSEVHEPIIKDRQIDFSNLEEGVHHSFVPSAATAEEPDWREDILSREIPFGNEELSDEINTEFSNEGQPEVDNEFKDIIFSDDIEPEEDERTPFGGLKLILLLAVVAALTFGFWYYFLYS